MSVEEKNIYFYIARMRGFYGRLQNLVGYAQSVKDFIKEIPFKPDEVFDVLDAGCGNGLYAFGILERFPNAKVTAFDINKTLAEEVHKKILQKSLSARASVFSSSVEGPLEKISGRDFDLIVTAGVLEYVPLEATVKNLSRFLKPGGFFLNSPVRDTLWGKFVAWVYGCWPYTRKQNLDAFFHNGFILEKILQLPVYVPASFKELHLFKKLGNLQPAPMQ